MSGQSFAELFEESLKDLNMSPGAIVEAIVVEIEADFVIVHAGLKSEGVIPRSQFLDEQGQLTVAIGDEVKVVLDAVEDGYGTTKLSREKAKQAELWLALETAFQNDEVLEGEVLNRVRGGFIVSVNSLQGFLPGSLADVRPVADQAALEGERISFKIVKLDEKRTNIVVSRRAVLEAEYNEQRDRLFKTLAEGAVLKGVVKSLTDYGAFVDLGGLDGLLHITDMSWARIKHPSECVAVGDEIDVKVLKFDAERKRVSLGIKQLTEDPWVALASQLVQGSKHPAKVTNVTDYGCFAQLDIGVEGLVHVSEMDWANRNVHPNKVVSVGQAIEVMVLGVDQKRRRISLGIKQCKENPWDAFASSTNKGDKVSGVVKSVTDFGVFVGLDGGIDGLVHLTDLSWDEEPAVAVKGFKKGQAVDAVVLSIDTDRERIGLGIKQLSDDKFATFAKVNKKGATVKGQVIAISAKHADVELEGGVVAQLRIGELTNEHIDSFEGHLAVGDNIEALVSVLDNRQRQVQISVKQRLAAQEKAMLNSVNDTKVDLSGPQTIGDLIKAQMEKSKK